MLFHVVGQFGQLFGGDAQRFGGMPAHGGHDLVVQILDEFRGFLFQSLGGFADGLTGARRSFFHFAIEVAHRLDYFLLWPLGQPRCIRLNTVLGCWSLAVGQNKNVTHDTITRCTRWPKTFRGPVRGLGMRRGGSSSVVYCWTGMTGMDVTYLGGATTILTESGCR